MGLDLDLEIEKNPNGRRRDLEDELCWDHDREDYDLNHEKS